MNDLIKQWKNYFSSHPFDYLLHFMLGLGLLFFLTIEASIYTLIVIELVQAERDWKFQARPDIIFGISGIITSEVIQTLINIWCDFEFNKFF